VRELKSKLEAILFCSPQGVELAKLAKLCGIGAKGHVKAVLNSIKEDLEKREAGIKLIRNENVWRFRVRDEHVGLVTESAKPEIDKAILQTLAFIAHKGSARQSDVVKLRSNKAYDHIKQLVDLGFVEAKKKGTTKLIAPTKKFYKYFNLNENEVLEVEGA